MRVPLSWLREYVDLEIPVDELSHRLTMAGIEVGEAIVIGGWPECFVGHVLSVQPHPQADRLSLCQVTTGVEEMEVVCGAPNVAAGQKVCFAKVGATLYNSHSGKQETLKPARIRGVVSQGMICSELELGLGDNHDGIVVLPEDAPTGMVLDQYLGDTVLDLELTPNRLDCLSILGIAREVAALTGKRVREPEVSYPDDGPPIQDKVSIYYKKWCIQVNKIGWKKREPINMPPEKPERFHQQVLRALSEELITETEAKQLLNRPVESSTNRSLSERRQFLKLPKVE